MDSDDETRTYDRERFKLHVLTKIIPLDEVKRDTYKFEHDLTIRIMHPYFTQYSIENGNKEFKCKYKGVTLNGKPHGMGKLELKMREDEDDSDEEESGNRSEQSEYDDNLYFKLYGHFVDGQLHGGPALICITHEDWLYVTNYEMGRPRGEIMTFRPEGYMARTPASPTDEAEVTGALEYAGPFYDGYWMSHPDKRPWLPGKLFYTRGDVF